MIETYDKVNHWYGFNGGECPVHPETRVEAAFAAVGETTTDVARSFIWGRLNDKLNDIIAFRHRKFTLRTGEMLGPPPSTPPPYANQEQTHESD